MKCSTAPRLLQVGCHSSDGVDFQVSVLAAAQLLGCFEGCPRVFGEIAEKGERVQPGGGKEMWFVDGMLSSAELAEKSLVGGHTGVKVSTMFCELPTFSFELEVMGDERPVEWRHPVGNEVMFLNPGLVVSVM